MKMIVGIITTIVGGLLLVFAIITLKYPQWTICIEYLWHIRDAGKIFAHILVQEINYELSLFNRVIKTHMCLKMRKHGMIYSK
jgi:hypothetical protein